MLLELCGPPSEGRTVIVAECFECGEPAEYAHHVVPRSRGGTMTVPLCGACHAKAHHRDKRMSTPALTATALAHKKARGERVGAVPYGWALDVDGVHLVLCAAEQGAISDASRLRAAGLSLRKVGAELQRRGVLTRNERPWQAQQVKGLLAAEVAR